MRFHKLLSGLAVLAALLGAPPAASAMIDGISASDLFAQHAYLRTANGIYYATTGVGGLTVNYLPNSDVGSIFLALATGLRPYSPDAAEPPGVPIEFGACGNACRAGGGALPSAAPDGVGAPDAGTPDAGTAGGSAPPGVASDDITPPGSEFPPPAAPPSAVPTVPAPEPASLALVLGCLSGLLILEGSRVLLRRPAV